MSNRSLSVSDNGAVLVRQAFKRKAISQQELAGYLGLARSTVNRFFRGKPIDKINFVEICNFLDLDWEEIAYENQDDCEEISIELQWEIMIKDLVKIEQLERGNQSVFFSNNDLTTIVNELIKLRTIKINFDWCRFIKLLSDIELKVETSKPLMKEVLNKFEKVKDICNELIEKRIISELNKIEVITNNKSLHRDMILLVQESKGFSPNKPFKNWLQLLDELKTLATERNADDWRTLKKIYDLEVINIIVNSKPFPVEEDRITKKPYENAYKNAEVLTNLFDYFHQELSGYNVSNEILANLAIAALSKSKDDANSPL